MPDIFLSYSRDDQVTARRFAESFEREGLSVWWDQTLRTGEAYDQVTEKALKSAKAVVVLWSKKSVDSRWVRSEATLADRAKTLMPVMIEPCDRPVMFELTHTADLSKWAGDANNPAWKVFLSDVRTFVNAEASGDSANLPVTRHTRKYGRVLIGIAAALLAAGVGLWAFKAPMRATAAATSTATPAAASGPASLAVLPFANLSSDPQQDYFSDGLTEEILNHLAQINGLRVTGRTSSFSFKGKNEDLRVIGEKLGVGNLLEGSIRKDGNQLRITAQLINAKDGSHRWSRTYARELKDVFALQEEIAKDVAEALSITLDVGDTSRAMGGTTSLAAYDKYLRATHAWSEGTSTGHLQALQLLRDAVALDPQFQQAWIALGAHLSFETASMPAGAVRDSLLQEGTRVRARIEALPLGAELTAYFRVGSLWQERRWAEAVAIGDAAMAARPFSNPDTNFVMAALLMSVGRISDSISYMQRMAESNPLDSGASFQLQMALNTVGRSAEAKAELERSNALLSVAGEREVAQMWYLWFSGNIDPATMKARVRSLLQRKVGALPWLFPVSADKLDDAMARSELRKRFDDPARQGEDVMNGIALYADVYGDRDLVLAALRRALIDLKRGWVPSIWQPFRSGVRSDPRFKELLKDLGLVDYFRASGKWGDFCKPVGADDFECH